MTTITQFTPPNNSAFTFNPMLDGTPYIATVRWNLYGQRWYLTITDTFGNLIVCRALIASADTSTGLPAINLVFGYFLVSTLIFRDSTQCFEVTP